ncbi:MAG: protein kinase [Chloroflexi bacterium]|nr:protein kinase [Chloroflexota bacterium]
MKDPMIGQQLANFRVERLLGQGGMATVYYGVDVKLQRPVAIKVIDKRYRDNPAYIARFIKEAQMMAQWRHENLIQIYYAGEKQGFSYYVMEYVDGDDLATVLSAYADEDAQMPNEDVLRIGYAVARALDYAHQRGVIHRDVKPSNVLIAKDGRVLLGDFGMALEVSDRSMGNVFGTPHYISPEQAKRSADAVPQSDLYSLGIILYEALTGAVPFDDPSPASIALMHITQNPPALRSFNPEISPAVEAVILRALEKKPKNRYQSGAALMSALEEALLKSAGSSPKLSLPPVPVGVPTIRQNRVSIEQMTRHLAAPKKKKGVAQPVAEIPSPAPRTQNKKRWILIPLLLLLGLGGWYFTRSGLFSTGLVPAPTFTSSPTPATEVDQPTQALSQPSATPTQLPPSATATSTATMTSTPVPTQTVVPTGTATQPAASPSPEPTIVVPTANYPNGNNLTLFWNETSFIMLNRSAAIRSVSGFIFQRLDANDQPTATFPGFRWENRQFKYIPPNNCVSIKTYKDEDPPYLNPLECENGYSGIIQPEKEREPDLFFWLPAEGSTQFRVLWLKEEIARCEISAGTCEIYVP